MAKKRKSGTGTVRQRGDGRWEGRVVIGYDDNGLPKTKNVLAKTKRECQEKLRQLTESMVGRNDRKVKSDMLFGDWLCCWYETHSKPTLRVSTRNNYENVIYNHVLPEIGKIPLNKLSQNDLQQFYGRLKKNGRKRLTEQYGAGLSDRMVRMCHAVCRSALERAVRDDLLRTNPAIGCKLPPKKAKEMQVLDREELQKFLIQAQADGYYELFLLDLCTGSGCIAISLAVKGGYESVTATDLSEEALKVAERNAKTHQKKIIFRQGDLFSALPRTEAGTFDIITSNPPYIPTAIIATLEPEVREHEPMMALDGTEDGLRFYRQIAQEAGTWLKPGGAIYLEIGYDQGEAVSGLLREAGFDKVRVVKDLPGKDRVVCGVWPG